MNNTSSTNSGALADDKIPERSDISGPSDLEVLHMQPDSGWPEWLSRELLASFLHENMKPYEDTVEDIERGLDFALHPSEMRGGFILLAHRRGELAGATVFLKTGMKGYVPENLLLFVAVRTDLRSKGIGRFLIERAIEHCEGEVKLHVEYDNPAKRLYERIGFSNKYAEMRLKARSQK